MLPAGFEHTIPVGERPKILASDSVATGIDLPKYIGIQPQFSDKPTN
jgi:hypothetical protein